MLFLVMTIGYWIANGVLLLGEDCHLFLTISLAIVTIAHCKNKFSSTIKTNYTSKWWVC